MGNLGAHVKSVHHLPFSKKLYEQHLESAKVDGEGAAEREALCGEGSRVAPETPSLGPRGLGLPASEGSSPSLGDPHSGNTSTPTPQGPPSVLPVNVTGATGEHMNNRKSSSERYHKKSYQNPNPESLVIPATAGGSVSHGISQELAINARPSPDTVLHSQLLAGSTSQGISEPSHSPDIRHTPLSSVTTIPTPSVQLPGAGSMAHPSALLHDLSRYQDMFTAAHPQHIMAPGAPTAAAPDLTYAANLPLPLYRPPTGQLHGHSPM